jgi:hypothetical protein
MDFTGYPYCANDDVLIVLEPGNWELKLHADVLRRHSKFFRDRLTEESAAMLSSIAKRASQYVRWRYDLVERPSPREDGPARLQMVVRLHLF